MSVEAGLACVRATRPAAQPNSGFMRQLAQFEATMRHTAAAIDGCSPALRITHAHMPCNDVVIDAPAALDSKQQQSLEALDMVSPCTPCGLASSSTGGAFPFDDEVGSWRVCRASGECTPSPQSSMGGCTPGSARQPTPAWEIPGFDLVTGFESPPSSPEPDCACLPAGRSLAAEEPREVPMIC